MNYIILEGLSLYLFLIITGLLFFVSSGCIICTMLSYKRESTIDDLFLKEKEKVRHLTKENFVLRLKCGEFDIDEL